VFDWPKDGKFRVPLKNDAKAAWLLAAPAKKLSGDARSRALGD
jgi:hypothetical protein